mmetsp:Transcript_36074/g.82161  ORF Transcript_36074/g.82161 Transcript_36074/m.82161 type:complete len:602 (-) Transcript_36074:409-2214(-)
MSGDKSDDGAADPLGLKSQARDPIFASVLPLTLLQSFATLGAIYTIQIGVLTPWDCLRLNVAMSVGSALFCWYKDIASSNSVLFSRSSWRRILPLAVTQLGMHAFFDAALSSSLSTTCRCLTLFVAMNIFGHSFAQRLRPVGLGFDTQRRFFGPELWQVVAALLIVAGVYKSLSISDLHQNRAVFYVLGAVIFSVFHFFLLSGREDPVLLQRSATLSPMLGVMVLFYFHTQGGSDTKLFSPLANGVSPSFGWKILMGLYGLIWFGCRASMVRSQAGATCRLSSCVVSNLHFLYTAAGVITALSLEWVCGFFYTFEPSNGETGFWGWLLQIAGTVMYALVCRSAVGDINFLETSGEDGPETIKGEREYRRWMAVALDGARLILAEIWMYVVELFAAVGTAIAPMHVRYFVYRAFQPPGVVVGIAHMFNPPNHPAPMVYQCNVGYMWDKKSKYDWFHTNVETVKILRQWSLDLPTLSERGLSGGLVVEFPLWNSPDGWARKYKPNFMANGYKQVNISGWKDHDAAMEWAASSEAHKNIVRINRASKAQGGMHTFSGTLVTLVPEGRYIFAVRCQLCGTPVSDYDNPPLHCNACDNPIAPHPRF